MNTTYTMTSTALADTLAAAERAYDDAEPGHDRREALTRVAAARAAYEAYEADELYARRAARLPPFNFFT